MWRAFWRSPDYRRKLPAPAPKFSIGRFSALRYRISRCRRRDNRPWSTNWCGCQRQILVCPVTKGPLEFDSTRQELISRSAKLAYPIRDGIPIMLPEEARKID